MANSLWLGKKCGCPVTALNLCRILPPTASSCGDQMAAIHRSWVSLKLLTTASDCKLADYEEPMSKRSWSDFDLCSQTDEWRFANNWRQIYGAINLKCNLCAMCFCNRGLDSAGCQPLVIWLCFYIKAKAAERLCYFAVKSLSCSTPASGVCR